MMPSSPFAYHLSQASNCLRGNPNYKRYLLRPRERRTRPLAFSFLLPSFVSCQCLPLAEPWHSLWAREGEKYNLEKSASLFPISKMQYQGTDKKWIGRYVGWDQQTLARGQGCPLRRWLELEGWERATSYKLHISKAFWFPFPVDFLCDPDVSCAY